MRGGAGSIDAGHVYSHLILGGQTTWPFNNDTGAGPFRLGTGGHAFWGKADVGKSTRGHPDPRRGRQDAARGLAVVARGHRSAQRRRPALVAPDGTVRDLSISGVSVFERASVSWRLPGHLEAAYQGLLGQRRAATYWSARTR